MNSLPQAELDPTDHTTVRCGNPRCRARLASITEYVGFPFVVFPAGCVRHADGTYGLSRRAEADRRYGRRPGYRRPWRGGDDILSNRLAPGQSSWPGALVINAATLPQRVQCWECGVVQVLDADRLDVRAWPWTRSR